jgi:Protein of unknown function (DUF2889)
VQTVSVPHYGSGTYRRLIRLHIPEPGCVQGALADDCHAFRVELRHDGQRVTAVDSQSIRYPLDVCPGAGTALQTVIGAPIDESMLSLKSHANHSTNCTHLFDLASLCIIQAAREKTERERLYEIAIPDLIYRRTTGVLQCNGRDVLVLAVDGGRISSPERYRGQNIFRGFARWAVGELRGEELAAALILQRGFLVSGARAHNLSGMGVVAALSTSMPRGVCFATQPDLMQNAVTRPENTLDFSASPETLLRWIA